MLNFNTAKAENFSWMFYNCANFNKNISAWNVASAIEWEYFRNSSALANSYTPAKFR